MIKERKEREERQTKILNTMKAVQKSSRTHVLNEVRDSGNPTNYFWNICEINSKTKKLHQNSEGSI
jgi:hypothetical protein